MKKKGKLCALVGALVVGLVGLELYCRIGLGLGDPPLSLADDKIEYLFAPNQSCRRFGNRIVYNDVSCRNAYDAASLATNDVVMLVLGDSVVNGGALTDHDKLGTTRAEAALRAHTRLRVLNASAGSWGPVNCAEYVRRFGTFNAKAVYLVLNPGDLWDVPDYTPIVGTRAFPDRKPLLASWELVDRYVIPRLANLVHPKKSRLETGEGLIRGGLSKDEAEARSKTAIAECLNRAPKRGVIYSRLRTDWAKAEPAEAEAKLRAFCQENRFEFHLLVLDPETDYRTNDNIHINENGQKKLGELLVTLAPSP